MHTNNPTPDSTLADLAAVPRRDDLARLVHTLLFSAADERRTRLSDGLAELSERMNIAPKDADTPHGNALVALERSEVEPPNSPGALLIAALLARSVALLPPEGAAAEARVIDSIVWLAAHTPIDALPTLDSALGQRADNLWRAAANLIRRIEAGTAAHIGRAGALLAAAALRASSSPVAAAEADALETRDPILRALLHKTTPEGASADAADAITLKGELVPPPRSRVVFLLLACTGVLAVAHVARLIARAALLYKKPAELSVSSRGITLKTRTELLGRTLRESESHVPVESLLRATRDVKFPRLSMYAGLFALAVGSYLGISLFVDGARVGSPELLGVGALLVAVGVALDFALVTLSARGRGRCRLIIEPRRGHAFAVGGVDTLTTDAALQKLIRRA